LFWSCAPYSVRLPLLSRLSLGAFVSLVESGKLKTSLHCLLCIAENSVSSKATRPDDVHLLYSGKSVEVNNPDAEGRLVLADGLAYAAKRYAPGLLVDMATLTGAQGTATGNKHAAIYASSEKIETIAVESGKVSGDLCHPLPYAPEFLLPEFHSAVADMKNSQKNRDNAGEFPWELRELWELYC
jgi:probable aminopeptidase NPEPL1